MKAPAAGRGHVGIPDWNVAEEEDREVEHIVTADVKEVIGVEASEVAELMAEVVVVVEFRGRDQALDQDEGMQLEM